MKYINEQMITINGITFNRESVEKIRESTHSTHSYAENEDGKITHLNCSNAKIHHLEEFLKDIDCSNCKELYLQDNQIRNLYRIDKDGKTVNFLDKLTNLKVLDLSGNQLRDISFLEVLQNLEELDLSNKGIRDINFLKKLKDKDKLEYLNLSNNKIKDIQALGSKNAIIFTNLIILYVHNNDFVVSDNTLKDEIIAGENHLQIINSLFSNLSTKLKSSKILLLGNHKAGKSTFLNYFYNIKYDGSTHILNIHKKDDINYFDFGGQDYYHGINQLFFSKKALNLLFWFDKNNVNGYGKDSTNDKIDIRNYKLEYWLYQIKYAIQKKEIELILERDKDKPVEDKIKSVESDNWKQNENPTLLIQTHADTPEETKKIDYFCDKFNITDFNILNDLFIGLPTLNKDGKEQETSDEQKSRVVQKDSCFYNFLKEYLQNIVENKKDNQLYSKEEAKILYKVNKIKKLQQKENRTEIEDTKIKTQTECLKKMKSRQENYFKNLHDDGEILNYSTFFDPNPADFTEKLYTEIFDKELLTTSKGRFYLKTDTTDSKKECTKNIDENIIKFLEHEKVIFRNKNDERECIVPSYLPLAEYDNDFKLLTCDFGKPNFTLKFLWFIPFGLINNLICYFGNLPDWRDNVIFTFMGEYKVRISLDFQKLSIAVYITETKKEHTINMQQVEQFIFYQILNLYWSLFDNNFVELKKRDDQDTIMYYAELKKVICDFLDEIKKIIASSSSKQDKPNLEKTNTQSDTQNDDLKKIETKIKELEDKLGITDKNELEKLVSQREKLLEEILKNKSETNKNSLITDKDNLKILLRLFPDDMYLSVDNEWFIKYSEIDGTKNGKLAAIADNIKDLMFDKEKQTNERPEQKELRLSDFRNYTFNENIMEKKKIFISYSRKDVDFKDTLNLHLQILEQSDIAVVWNCEKIDMNLDWDSQIQQQLDESNMIIYLLSPNFFSSYYVLTKEIFEKEYIKNKDKKILLVKVGEYPDLGKLKELVPDDRKNNLIGRLSNLETYKMLPYGRIENKVTGQSEEKIIPLDQYRFFCGSINPAMKQIVDLIIDTIH
ncbi:hypothetical protein AGMMS49574_17720 [Bacteroidia bacterium]|nr:hypothetical protein AGMMS49574_17720 [Bacteroidia bacterium]